MTSGIFHVEFRASTGDFGDGLVVVKDGAVNDFPVMSFVTNEKTLRNLASSEL